MTNITKATFKSFIKKNKENLLICRESNFDGMEDCVVYSGSKVFRNITTTTDYVEHTLGFAGLWLVGCSRDYFKHYEDDKLVGIKVYNSCGSSIIAVQKQRE